LRRQRLKDLSEFTPKIDATAIEIDATAIDRGTESVETTMFCIKE
jgi:hypothetical protein